MDDYIKRSEAIEQVALQIPFIIDGLETPELTAQRIIGTCQSADVVERKHGEWEIEWWQEGHKVRRCSYCKRSQTVNIFNGEVMFNFCPYCGVDMREGI